ncbi:restriction endonuclease subunit S [Streptomyces europaeiscabiei]|uniref:restriction endonuclease subunit S n=1 Tax=Streptomyces europaeiscabiei TaxID=146819 RepID=UPI0029B0CFAC|nr:restriction endonuclease subunit S [Streptomyces europaeiscabiei]MDX2771337.1 restriction endonuclease subunit S [Streptomyces europaeiscabiei]MDX3830973.1 restriction endonuclease subunit S [Streptomyces europaeiscabiei]
MAEQRVTFADLAKTGEIVFGDGYRTKKSEHGKPGLPILRVAEVHDGAIRPEFADFVSNSYREAMGRKVSRAGDVVLTTKGTVGRVAIIPNGSPEFVYSPQVCFFRADSGVQLEPRYLYYWFKSSEFWEQAGSRKSQTDMADYLNLSDIRSLSITLPDILQQRAITEVLGALDDKVAVNERIRDTALNLARTYYEAASTTCESQRIGDLAALFDGPHATPQKTEVGPWFLSISSLNNGYLDLAESAHLSEEDFPRWTRRVQPQAGDVLFSYETRLGDAALMPPGVRGSLGRRMALLRSKSASVSGALLLHAYLSSGFQEEIKRRSIHGATVDRLPLREMPGWPIALPAEAERERLSTKLDLLHARVTQVANENRALATLRDTLLPQLMSGKLRVRDAEKIVEGAV